MSSTKKMPPRFHIGDWVKFDYGPRKVSAKIVEDRGPLGVKGRRLYRVQLDEALGEASIFEMPENELEAEVPPVRLSYDVQYVRQGDTNMWHVSAGKGRVLKGVKAKGAVAYSTAFYEGEKIADQRFASVQVLLEVDPSFDEATLAASPIKSRELVGHATSIANEMFLSRHPRAKVELPEYQS